MEATGGGRICVERAEPPLAGLFVARPNRFLGVVSVDGVEIEAHIADPGRLEELLVPGRRAWVSPAPEGAQSRRKTQFDMVAVESGQTIVSVDTQVPNRLALLGLREGAFEGLQEYREIAREWRYGKSRIDFRLSGDQLPDCLLEVKSVTLVEDGRALFPDAPTTRGARHLGELASASRSGLRAEVLFLVQRDDARECAPNVRTDPEFAEALYLTAAAGVGVRAHICHVTPGRVCLGPPIPVDIPGWAP
jgi:sugar fermentation stimulation protein A